MSTVSISDVVVDDNDVVVIVGVRMWLITVNPLLKDHYWV